MPGSVGMLSNPALWRIKRVIAALIAAERPQVNAQRLPLSEATKPPQRWSTTLFHLPPWAVCHVLKAGIVFVPRCHGKPHTLLRWPCTMRQGSVCLFCAVFLIHSSFWKMLYKLWPETVTLKTHWLHLRSPLLQRLKVTVTFDTGSFVIKHQESHNVLYNVFGLHLPHLLCELIYEYSNKPVFAVVECYVICWVDRLSARGLLDRDLSSARVLVTELWVTHKD